MLCTSCTTRAKGLGSEPMPRSRRTLRRVSSSKARATLADLLEQVGDDGERVLIERRGKPPVALLSVDDLQRYQLLEDLLERLGGHV